MKTCEKKASDLFSLFLSIFSGLPEPSQLHTPRSNLETAENPAAATGPGRSRPGEGDRNLRLKKAEPVTTKKA